MSLIPGTRVLFGWVSECRFTEAPTVNLSSRESEIVFRIMAELSSGHGSRALRDRIGPLLLRLLNAQFFASFVWSKRSARFEERVAINMTDENLCAYETHYQFCDPITPALQRRRRATAVAEIISRRRLESTEFFNDFLARDGLHFGMNYYAYAGGFNIGDLRLWRARDKDDFSCREVEILDLIGPAFTNAMRTALAREGHEYGLLSLMDALDHVQAHTTLTRREKEIAFAVLLGKSDRQIADECGIAYTTVRTHLNHVFEKLGVSSRNQLFRRLAAY